MLKRILCTLVSLFSGLIFTAILLSYLAPAASAFAARPDELDGARDTLPAGQGILEAPDNVVVVNTTSDFYGNDGFCSLREAIEAANSDQRPFPQTGECQAGYGVDLISLSALNGSIYLSQSLPAITSDLLLQGPGPTYLALDGRHEHRILLIEDGHVLVTGLTIANGFSGPDYGVGAGVHVTGSAVVTITDTVIRDNEALGESGTSECVSQPADTFGGGAGIYHGGSGSLYLVRATVEGNRATGGNGGYIGYSTGGGGGGGGFGAGLFNESGTVYVLTSTLRANTVVGGKGGLRGPGGSTGCRGAHGGGKYQDLGGGGRGGYDYHPAGFPGEFAGGGGGGEGPSGQGGTSLFAGGTGGNGGASQGGAGGGGAGLGAGIFNRNGIVIVRDSTFTENRAVGGDGPENGEDGQGIASAIFNSATLTLENNMLANLPPLLDGFLPADGAEQVPPGTSLSWNVSDPDAGEVLYGYRDLTVTLSIGTDPAALIQVSTTLTSYTPASPLELLTTYYWVLTATDGLSTTGTGLMSFTTLTPTVDFDAQPRVGPRPLIASFVNQSLGVDSYLWQFGDGTSSTELAPAHEYTQTGVYTVSLQATGVFGGGELTRTNFITVYQAPLPTFAATPSTGLAPLTVVLTNSSQFSDSYLWNYGDGLTSTIGATVHTHTYGAAGTYSISLAATNAFTTAVSAEKWIYVYSPPVADFTAAPVTGAAPLMVSFTNSSLFANYYHWSFGDGWTSWQFEPNHVYASPGVYTVTLTAFSQVGSSQLVRPAYISVYAGPQPGFSGAPRAGLAPLTVTFTNTSQLADSFLWNHGDGTTSDSAALTHTHAYSAPGSYTVSLTAINAQASATLTESEYITVYETPVADFEAAPREGVAPLEVGFGNLSVGGTDYDWHLGDGSTSTDSNPIHVYANAGVYTVSLLASNPVASHELTRTGYITVLQGPQIDLVATGRVGPSPLPVTFTNNTQYADSYLWDYGDGTTSEIGAISHTHTYTSAGVYTVTLTATNGNSQTTAVFRTLVAALALTEEQVYYVDALFGTDVTGTGGVTQPWRTISHALNQTNGPDATIYVASGTYDEAHGETFPIVMKPGVSVKGVDRTAVIVTGNSSSYVFHFTDSSVYTETTVLSGLKITNGNVAVEVTGRISDPPSPTIADNWIAGNTDGIRNYTVARQRVYGLIRGNLIEGNSSYGIYNNAGYNGTAVEPVIADNVIRSNGLAGVYCYAAGSGDYPDQSSCSPTLRSNLIVNNLGDGFYCRSNHRARCNALIIDSVIANNADYGLDRYQANGESLTKPTIINTLIYGNGSGGARFYTGGPTYWQYLDQPTFINSTVVFNGSTGIIKGRPRIVNSIVWGHDDDVDVAVEYISYSDIGEEAYALFNHNISADPLFVDAGLADFHLSADSPAINAGNNEHAGLPEQDFEGDPRIFDGAVDMGADERLIPLVVKKAGPIVAAAGGPLTYTIAVTNMTATSMSLVVTDTLPAQVVPANVLTWMLTLSPLSGWTETIVVSAPANYVGVLTNVVIAQSSSGFSGTAFATTMAAVPVQGLVAASSSPTPLGLATAFTATIAQGSDANFHWVFGDGTMGSGANVNHIYAAPGIYTATAVASNLVSVVTTTTPVVVDALILGLVADNDSPTVVGDVTVLSATTAAGSNITYAWDFGDGEYGEGAVVSHVYPNAGNYLATVTASNSVSQQTAETAVQVEELISGLVATNDSPAALGKPTTLSATIDTGTEVVYTWDFGDGKSGVGAFVSHLYLEPGIFTATVTATNQVSQESTETMVLVEEAIEGLAATNDSPTPLGQATTLTATVTSGSNVVFTWDFGDGETGEGGVVSHVFSAAGVYTVTVTATNSVSIVTATTVVTVEASSFQVYLPAVVRQNNALGAYLPRSSGYR